MVLVATLSNYSVISLIYLAMVFVCWLAHYLSSNPHVIKKLWLSFVVCDGLILVVKYAYQFGPIHTFVQNKYMLNECILILWRSSATISFASNKI